MPNTPESISYIKIGENEFPIDAVTVNGKTFPDDLEFLPGVTSEDEDKMLTVLQKQQIRFPFPKLPYRLFAKSPQIFP